MQQELNCPKCGLGFDTCERTPQMLPRCGHSMCMRCLKQMQRIVCPEDNLVQPNDLNQYPVNQTILKIISRNSMRNSQADSTDVCESLRISRLENYFEVIDPNFVCQEHNKKIELVCLDDFFKICVSCALFGNHKHHNVKNLEEVIQEIQVNLEETMTLVSQVQQKVKTLKQPSISKKIRDQIKLCMKQQQLQAEEHFKEMMTQLMMKQRKTMDEIEQRYRQIEDQMIKKEQAQINQILEKSDLWILAAQEKLNQFSLTTEKGDIAFFLLTKDQSNHSAKIILEEVEEYLKQFQTRLTDLHQQKTCNVGKDLLSNFECSYPQVQQSFYEDQNILRDQSVMIDQSFLKELDDKPPHNEFLIPSLMLSNVGSPMSRHSQPQKSMIFLPSAEKRLPSQHESLVSSPKLKRQSSMSPKRPIKKKLPQKVEALIQNCQDTLDVSQQDLGDELALLVEEAIRGKKFKIVKLCRNKISDTAAIRLMEINTQAIHLQSNVITERLLDLLLQLLQKQQISIKSIYLSQNLMNQFRVKKKIEELKKQGIAIIL